MKSMGVLEKELELMDHIIKFKKTDYDDFESKKDIIQCEMEKISNQVNCGIIDIDTYKKIIQNQLNFEQELIKRIDTDDYIKNKNFVKKRIMTRINIIKEELAQEVPENEEEEVIDEKAHEHVEENLNAEDKSSNKKIEKDESQVLVEDDVKVSLKKEKPNPIESIKEKPKPRIKDEEIYEKAKRKLIEYKAAVEYFIKIDSSKQAEDAKSKVVELNKGIKLMEEGKAVDEFSLPIDITPDYITGMTKQERLNNFATITKDFSKQKNELNAKMTSAVNTLKSEDKKKLAKMKDEIKKSLDHIKSKIDNLTNIINKLKEMADDPWTPAPLFSMKEVEEEEERINEDIPINNVEISIGKITHPSIGSVSHLDFMLQLAGDRTMIEMIRKPVNFTNGDFMFKKVIKFEKGDYNSLQRKSIKILLYERQGFCCFVKNMPVGECMLKLDPLKGISEMITEATFKTLSGGQMEENGGESPQAGRPIPGVKLSIGLKLRTPIGGKELITTSTTQLVITKTFPPFKGGGGHVVIEDKSSTSPPKKPVDSKKANKPNNPNPIVSSNNVSQNTQNTQNQAKPKGKPIEVNESDFRKEELENPDDIENLVSLKVLEMKIKKAEEESKKIEGRVPPKLREKMLMMRVKHKVSFFIIIDY
jgi:hypothetical protein